MPLAATPGRTDEPSAKASAMPAMTTERMRELRASGAHRSPLGASGDRRERAFLAWMRAAPGVLSQGR